MQLTSKRQNKPRRRLQSARRVARGKDEGQLVTVLVLVVGLFILSLVAVVTVANGILVAHSDTTGEQAVAQANSGIRDALFHIDQMSDSIQPFCLGTPPSGTSMPSGVSSCLPPLADAPNLLYYGVQPVSSTDVNVVSVGKVGHQTRTAYVTFFQVLNGFAIFAATGMTFKGNFSSVTVSETDAKGHSVGGPGCPANNPHCVNIGVGPGGKASCNGGGSNGNVNVVGGPGADVSSCNGTISGSTIVPAAPTVCTAGQLSTAFAPCINTSTYAVEPSGAPNPGSPYCPLPGITGLVAGVYAYVPSTLPQNAVYDCDTGGNAVTMLATSSQKIPGGSYYITANAATVGPIDPAAMTYGNVSFFVLPQACTPTSCAPATVSSANPASGCNSTSPPSSVSLSLSGTINLNSSDVATNGPNLNVYWGGCGSVPVGTGSHAAQFGGNLYLPGGSITSNGGKFYFNGSLVVGNLTVHGAPNFAFTYPEHQTQVLQSWTQTNYRITV